MIEQVARAMFEKDRPDDDYDKFFANSENPRRYERMARAGIAAMRVPTDRMALVDTDPEGATLIWQRMIDEALK